MYSTVDCIDTKVTLGWHAVMSHIFLELDAGASMDADPLLPHALLAPPLYL